MRERIRAGLEIVAAVAAAVGCALSWLQVRSTVAVAPILAGQPDTTSLVYHPPMLLLTHVLAAAAGAFAVVGVARLWRSQHPFYTP